MATDLTRWARDCNIPWKQGWPENYPFKATTLKVQRALAACAVECPSHYPDVVAALYHAFWADKAAVQLPEVYGSIIARVLGDEIATRVADRVSSSGPALSSASPSSVQHEWTDLMR